MKKLLSALLILTLTAMMLAGCNTASNKAGNNKETSSTSSDEITTSEEPKEQSDGQKYEPVDIRIGGLKGPTSIGMVKLMESAEAGTAANNYSFTIAGSADELTPKLIQGELDIAAVPANLASVLYNNTNKAIKLLAVNTLGVLYIVEKGSAIDSLDGLKGKTIYATGKGSVPEYNLRYLLSQNGIDPDKDVTIEWKTEPTEVVALLKETDGGTAMLPQPYVTVAQTQVEGLNIAVDLTQAWDELNNGSALITGVLVVRKEFAEKYPGQIAAFLDEYKLSTEYVNANVSEAAKLVEKFDIVKAAVAEKAIPYCNITYLEGAEMKDAMEGYLGVLFEQNPKSVGGVLPEDDFYYAR